MARDVLVFGNNLRFRDDNLASPLEGKGDSGNKVTATDEVLEREADSLPYGSPLPKSEFAKGSEQEIPRLAPCLRDSSLPLGMTVGEA